MFWPPNVPSSPITVISSPAILISGEVLFIRVSDVTCSWPFTPWSCLPSIEVSTSPLTWLFWSPSVVLLSVFVINLDTLPLIYGIWLYSKDCSLYKLKLLSILFSFIFSNKLSLYVDGWLPWLAWNLLS